MGGFGLVGVRPVHPGCLLSSRACVHVNEYADADGGVSPNQYIPHVTVDLRVFFPPVPGENVLTALDALEDAFERARFELYQHHQELNPSD